MHAKSVAYFVSFVLSLAVFSHIGLVAAQTNYVSFEGAGVEISLSFPQNAHPNDSITHAIQANTTVSTPLEIVLNVYAPVGSTFQLIKSNASSWAILGEGRLPEYSVPFSLPQNTNGTLRCVLNVRTNQLSDYMSFTFYTTQVRSVSYGELLSEYGALFTNYSKLLGDYENLVEEYDGLRSENIGLISSHETLLNEYNEVKANYSSLLTSDAALQNEYDVKKASYASLLTEFNNLHDNYTSLQQDYASLEDQVSDLEQQVGDLKNAPGVENVVILILIITVAGLIALIAYIKRKKQEPYLVIRKETIGVKEENQ